MRTTQSEIQHSLVPGEGFLGSWGGIQGTARFGIEVPSVPLREGVIQRGVGRDLGCGLGLSSHGVPSGRAANWGCRLRASYASV